MPIVIQTETAQVVPAGSVSVVADQADFIDIGPKRIVFGKFLSTDDNWETFTFAAPFKTGTEPVVTISPDVNGQSSANIGGQFSIVHITNTTVEVNRDDNDVSNAMGVVVNVIAIGDVP